MKIAREGYPLIVTAAVVTILPFALGWVGIGVILGVCTIAIAGFFRDPERTIPTGDGLIVSPADGKVVSIVDIKGDPRFTEATARVSIFLSPLDVHINRSPVTGKIEQANYQRGKFLAAYKDEASARNEQNTLKLVDERGRRLGVVQVAGVVARRIICRVQRGDSVKRGDRFGLIMFGSRTDAYLPRGCRIEVTEGQRVKGGETILGRFV
ncbi:MAG TPA: phosphatidylserine decarboxylase family protein [Candidatus Binatia bacterium]